MPKAGSGWKTLLVREEYLVSLKRIFDREKHALLDRNINTFNKYVDHLVFSIIEDDEILQTYGPFLEEIGIEADRIFIRDNKKDRIVEVVLQEGNLFCLEDNRDNCAHVGFAWAIPRIYKEMNLRGKKKPKTG